METNLSAYRGCLLGLAVGDAMGCTVDSKNLDEILRDYGPDGLLGYDLVNGHAEISSYTQIAAFACNGLLLGLTRGHPGPSMGYARLALKEWAYTQHFHRDSGNTSCWLCKMPQLRRHNCMDARTLDTLTRDVTGTPEEPANRAVSPGTLTAAIAIGLLFYPERMPFEDIGRLGAQIVALTHGEPMAFLTGSVLAYAVAGIIQEPECPLKDQFLHAAAAVAAQFGQEYPQARELQTILKKAVSMSLRPLRSHAEAMEKLECSTSAQVLAGAVYAALASNGDFDTAMIIAVNHSGKSAAVGALTGALLGAMLGEEALPEFYLECLDCTTVLQELATDLFHGCPREWVNRLFDDAWDQKYTHGQPVEKDGWAEE